MTNDSLIDLLDELCQAVADDARFIAGGTPAGNPIDPSPRIEQIRKEIIATREPVSGDESEYERGFEDGYAQGSDVATRTTEIMCGKHEYKKGSEQPVGLTVDEIAIIISEWMSIDEDDRGIRSAASRIYELSQPTKRESSDREKQGGFLIGDEVEYIGIYKADDGWKGETFYICEVTQKYQPYSGEPFFQYTIREKERWSGFTDGLLVSDLRLVRATTEIEGDKTDG
jgi:hypothetical protein